MNVLLLFMNKRDDNRINLSKGSQRKSIPFQTKAEL
jgi:hypothetical protein